MMDDDVDDLLKFDIEDVLNKFETEIIHLITPEIAERLDALLSGSKTSNFAETMNKKYEEENRTDENGLPLRIEVPTGILGRSSIDGDGSLSFMLTPAEDRWFRADHAFGSRLLEKLDLLYIVGG